MTTPLTAPSVFGHFNARFATVENLADVFVPSEEFATVSKQAHTVVLGPRGSGKTCLLKMLQPASLFAWKTAEAEEYKATIGFVGIYVPTDISWRQQIKNLGSPGLPPEYQLQLEKAAVTVQVLHALVATVVDCLATRSSAEWADVALAFESEAKLVSEFSKRWAMRPSSPTFYSLKQALAAAAMDIWRFARKETILSETGRPARFAEEAILSLDFVDEVILATGLINDEIHRPNKRWALLFDELEIAPDWLLSRLLMLLRSTNQRVFFKLSLSPFSQALTVDGPMAASPGHDFDLVRLWYAYKQDAFDFCERLLTSILLRAGIIDPQLYSIFGYSPLKGGAPSPKGAYSHGSRNHQVLTNAYRTDLTFRAYCDEKQINLDAIEELAENDRASLIRKIVPLLVVRQEFRKKDKIDSAIARTRSRKKTEIYGGLETFFEVMEGNPRWLVGIANELLGDIKKKGKVSALQQYDQIQQTAARFLAILNTVPISPYGSIDPPSLGGVLEAIGQKIFKSVVEDGFISEPYGSFEVDEETPSDVIEALGTAINAGAIILLPPEVDDVLRPDRITGKTFRLTYLLSPIYGIPTRIGRPFPLSSVLKSRNGEGERIEKISDRILPGGTEQLGLSL